MQDLRGAPAFAHHPVRAGSPQFPSNKPRALRNQPELEREVREYFEAASEEDFDRPEIDNEETSEEGHGRIEHRSYFLSTDLSSLSGVAKWSGLKAIGMVQSERHCAGRVSFEQRYYITSLGDAKSFQRAVRSHWGIENGLHWRLDVTVPGRRKPNSSRQCPSQYRGDSPYGDEPAQARQDEDQLQEEANPGGSERCLPT